MSLRKPTPFAEGYQAALADVLRAWRDGGPDAARAWIDNNLIPRDKEVGA